MTLATELILAELVDTLGDTVLLSYGGDGSPLLDELDRPPVRFAVSPIGGGLRRGRSIGFERRLIVQNDADGFARRVATAPLIIDAAADEADELMKYALEQRPAILRLRGQPSARPNLTDLLPLYEDETSGDALWSAPSLLTNALTNVADAHRGARIDEFDALSRRIGERAFLGFEHHAKWAELNLAPISVLDDPDERQLLSALSLGVVPMARDGGATLALPRLTAAPFGAGVGLRLSSADAPSPMVEPSEPGWAIETRRDGPVWEARLSPDGATPRPSVLIEIANGGPEAVIDRAWTVVQRRRGAWEAWDEAEAQLSLEESW